MSQQPSLGLQLPQKSRAQCKKLIAIVEIDTGKSRTIQNLCNQIHCAIGWVADFSDASQRLANRCSFIDGQTKFPISLFGVELQPTLGTIQIPSE